VEITRRSVCAGLFAGLITTLARSQTRRSSTALVLPTDADIRKILAERIRALAGPEDGIGIVVGIVGPQGRRVVSCGRIGQGDRRQLSGDTVFEIGSISKVFTALLLAAMVEEKQLALSDPVSKYLPAGTKVPERNGRSISLVDLATHTSGLPFMPDIEPVFNDSIDGATARKNSAAQLYQFLGRYELPRDPGVDWDYSNIGYWLLGQALAFRAGMDYEELLQTRVIAPLRLDSTAISLSLKLKGRLAVGHNAILQPAPPFSSVSIYNAMPAAGGLYSTVNDLVTLLSAATGIERSPLASSMSLMLRTRRPIGETEQALGWVVEGKGPNQLIMHDGFTWGYASYVAWDPAARVGVVVLSNQLTSVGDIGLHILRPTTAVEHPTVTLHIEIRVDPGVLDAKAGNYESPEEGIFKITRERDFLTIQLPIAWGLPKFRLRPESLQNFFVAELPIRASFQADSNGQVNGLLVYPPRGQHALAATRIK
jgi:D-alanyl-D-alanine-carboxypeptidase/D-alanyl-D-alanine-endopeptidase